jgi:hypothetical protein
MHPPLLDFQRDSKYFNIYKKKYEYQLDTLVLILCRIFSGLMMRTRRFLFNIYTKNSLNL